MLKLKHKHYISFPHVDTLFTHPMQLSEVLADGDELAQAIVDDPEQHDNRWDLAECPDTDKLEAFWATVTDDLKSDPTWTDFAKE